jgi:hypothetical protein
MAALKQEDLAGERQDRIERCWLCGIRLSIAQMVPDGGSACADLRWYCRDMRACTGRWTVAAWPPGRGTAVSGKSSAVPPGAPSGEA